MATTGPPRAQRSRRPASQGRPARAAAWPTIGAIGRGLLLVHLLLSPLLFSVNTLEMFEYPKVLLLELTALALAALGLMALAGLPPERRRPGELVRQALGVCREPTSVGVVLFTLSACVSTVTSISPRTSLLGAHESYGGLGTVLAYAVLFFATRALCRTAEDGRRLLAAPVVGAAVAAAYAGVQLAGLDPVVWDNSAVYEGYARPFGPLGHANFLAAFLAMAAPLVVGCALQAGRERRRGALAVFVLVGGLAGLVLLASISRGAWLAAAAAGLVLLAGGLRAGLDRRRVALAAAALAVAVGGGLALGLAAGAGDKGLGGHVLERARRLTEASSRWHIWCAGWRMFRERPLVGCGLDAFQLAFQRQRTPDYWQAEWQATPTRAHSEPVHVLATQGLLGAAALAVLAAGLARTGVRAWQRAGPGQRPLLLTVCAALVAFCVQDAVSFTVAGCGTLFITLAALLTRLGGPLDDLQPDAASDSHRTFVTTLLAAGGLALLAFFGNAAQGSRRAEASVWLYAPAVGLALLLTTGALLRLSWPGRHGPAPRPGGQVPLPVRVAIIAGAGVLAAVGVVRPLWANLTCMEGEVLQAADWRQALDRYERAAAQVPGREVYWVKLGTLAQAAARLTGTPAGAEQLRQKARQAFDRAVALEPLNSYNHANRGRFLAELAAAGLARPEPALAGFDAALGLDPGNACHYAEAAQVALGLGEAARAKDYSERGMALYPHFGPLLVQRAYVAMAERRPEEAAGLLRRAIDAGDFRYDEPAILGCLASYGAVLLRLGQYGEALAAVLTVIERRPDWAEPRFTRAKALELLGRPAEALCEYEHVLRVQPDHELARAASRHLSRLLLVKP